LRSLKAVAGADGNEGSNGVDGGSNDVDGGSKSVDGGSNMALE